MGCGCGKKVSERTNPVRTGLVARQNPAPAVNPNTNSVQVRNSGKVPAKKLNRTGIMEEQKRVQQMRRNAILRNLNKKK